MLEFKEALSEWKGMPSLLHIDDTASVAGESELPCNLQTIGVIIFA